MNIKGEVTLVAIATASTGTAFVDLTNRRLIKFVEFAKTPQWLYGCKYIYIESNFNKLRIE